MGKRTKNNSKRLKTSHKKALVKRKVVHTHIARPLANINAFIGQNLAHANPEQQPTAQFEAESMSVDQLRKLLEGPGQPRNRPEKLSVADASYLEALLKRWGTDYQRMSKDVRLNRMQWTARQIEKKHDAYKILVQNDQQ